MTGKGKGKDVKCIVQLSGDMPNREVLDLNFNLTSFYLCFSK